MVFVADGDEGIGSVREIHADGGLTIYIENAGDFVVPMTVVKAVHSGKVILDVEQLDPPLRAALGHAREAEDPDYEAPDSPTDGLRDE